MVPSVRICGVIGCLIARSYAGGLAVMGAGALLSPVGAEPRVARIARAIIRHASGGSCRWRRNSCYRRSLDDNLRRRWNIGGGAAGFPAGLVGGSATAGNEKRDRKTEDGDCGYFVFHLINLTRRDQSRSGLSTKSVIEVTSTLQISRRGVWEHMKCWNGSRRYTSDFVCKSLMIQIPL